MFFRRIDDFMIDKVFQRAADMMAKWVTPRTLAQNALLLASLLQIWLLWLYWMACRTNPPARHRQEFGQMVPNKI